MKKLCLYDHPAFSEHNPGEGHPERPERLHAIRKGIEGSPGLEEHLIRRQPEEISVDTLRRIHTSEHVERILAMRGETRFIDGDTATSPRSVDAALLAAGSVVQAVNCVLERDCDSAFCAVRPPGHHAERDRAMGFCLFNNVAAGAEHAIAERGLSRVFIFDPDVHHGNGTQDIFYDRQDVFYFSIHQYPFYPGTGGSEETGIGAGEGFTANVPLPAGRSDAEYLYVTEELLLPSIEKFRPEIVLISSGFDAHYLDPLGGMSLSTEGFLGMYKLLSDKLDTLGVPAVFVLEGGYSLEVLEQTVPALLKSLIHGFPELRQKKAPHPSVKKQIDALQKKWGAME